MLPGLSKLILLSFGTWRARDLMESVVIKGVGGRPTQKIVLMTVTIILLFVWEIIQSEYHKNSS